MKNGLKKDTGKKGRKGTYVVRATACVCNDRRVDVPKKKSGSGF
jgi:hypothetical protein